MNTQLVDSLIQVIRALPKAEQKMLIDNINLLSAPTETTEPTLENLEIASAAPTDEEAIDEEAWEVWRSLGDDAVPGRLENPSINHDRYLYSQPFCPDGLYSLS